MIDMEYSKIYLRKGDYHILKNEPTYVQKRYFIIALMLQEKPFGISRAEGAGLLRISKRHVYRLLRRFKDDGIPGLRFRSTKPKTSPNITPEWIETIVTGVRERTGFSPQDIAAVMNEAAEEGNKVFNIGHSTVNKILRRNGYYEEKPEEEKKKWKSFDWKRKNHLIQADLTLFNGIPVLTMEDDHTRKGWAKVLNDMETDTITAGMHHLVPFEFDNILTDNGKQFRPTNMIFQTYLNEHVTGKHIHTGLHHPQTMGKLSAYQKNLKRFLRYNVGTSRDRRKIQQAIDTYNLWYNNGKFHSVIRCCPEEKYSDEREKDWYMRLMKRLKLVEVLSPLLCGG